MKALGMIEVYGRLGAIEGLDSALKAANVSLVNMIRVGGGLTTFLIEGDVGAVKAAIDASKAASEKVGKLLSAHVIPRPDAAVRKMLDMMPEEQNAKTPVDKPVKEFAEEAKPETMHEKEPMKAGTKKPKAEPVQEVRADFEAMTVGELRKLARGIEDFPLSKQEIKFAKKKELIAAMKNSSNMEV